MQIGLQNYPFTDVVETRVQTPTKTKAVNVQIGPGDIISNIPVVMDFAHHQIHEGEAFLAQYVDTGLDTNTVKFGLTAPTKTTTIQGPHLQVSCDIYNGSARIDIYKSATISGGSTVTAYNRNLNSTASPGLAIVSGPTATNGTLIESMFVGVGMKGSDDRAGRDEWVLASAGVYRVDLTGLAAGTDAILHFHWYEDLGV